MYIPRIKADLDEHMESMRRRRKRKSTLNPNFPSGTHRPCELMLRTSHGVSLTRENLDVLDEAARGYWGSRAEAVSDWERDPLRTKEARAMRSRIFDSMTFTSMKAEYRALRQLTLDIMGMAINHAGL